MQSELFPFFPNLKKGKIPRNEVGERVGRGGGQVPLALSPRLATNFSYLFIIFHILHQQQLRNSSYHGKDRDK